MPTDVNYRSDEEIIENVITGAIEADDIRKCTAAVIALQNEHGVCEVLINAVEMQLAPTAIDVYELPQMYDEGGLDRSTRFALVMPTAPTARGIAQFYETVCSNRSWSVQSFESRSDAVAWLTPAMTA